jgi:hypothetical protein
LSNIIAEMEAALAERDKMLRVFIHLYQRGEEPSRWELDSEDNILADLRKLAT